MSGSATLLLGVLWCVVAIVWLASVGKAKPRWMHWLHAAVPLVALIAYRLMPGDTLGTWLVMGAAAWAMVSLAWVAGSALRNHGVMDVAYPLAAFAPILAAYRIHGEWSTRHTVIVLLVALWALRLALHVGVSNLPRGETEPYAKWRVTFGARWWWLSYFHVHMLQGTLIWIWLLPAALAMAAPGGALGVLDGIAIGVWGIGFLFQAAGDAQLRRFKRDPANRGKVMDSGLWSLTRHPNYFGETLMWGALALFALAHPLGIIGMVSVAYVVWFMAFGSATPMLERHMMKTKPGYAEYAARVPRFMPRCGPRRSTP